MRIEESYYGDFKVMDELAFTTADIIRAATLILKYHKVRVLNWPVTIDFNEKTGYWEVWFTKPVSDEEYIKRVPEADPGELDYQIMRNGVIL